MYSLFVLYAGYFLTAEAYIRGIHLGSVPECLLVDQHPYPGIAHV